MNEVLSVHELTRSFGASKALDQISFSLARGERLAVLGSSGSGKTTLLRLIAGLDAPSAGEITLFGKRASASDQILIPPEWREVALVFQGLALFPHLNALDQIAFAAQGRGGRQHVRALLEQIGLGDRASATLDQLSGGERQRIALARAFAQRPKILLMDEPFASLDDEKRAEMRELLRSLLDERDVTLILVTHARQDALSLADRLLILDGGRLVANDDVETVLLNPKRGAVVRALGLGQLVRGVVRLPGEARTAFGPIKIKTTATESCVLILVRPGQPQLATGSEGIEAEVVSLGWQSPQRKAVRRVATIRAAGELLRLIIGDSPLTIGSRVRVRIEEECDVIQD